VSFTIAESTKLRVTVFLSDDKVEGADDDGAGAEEPLSAYIATNAKAATPLRTTPVLSQCL
jgi:hypothetical protein